MSVKENEAACESVNERRFAEGMERAREMEETAEYAAFVEKFVPKKTTDECYTPALVYEVVRGWAVERYGLQGREIVRPFYPGGDYERAEYPEGCVVIDNPPFSMISKICAFYQKNEIPFFLFAPGLTLFSTNAGKCNYVVTDVRIRYVNAATVNTGFVTNLGAAKITVAQDLRRALLAANGNGKREMLPKYEYTVEVIGIQSVTAAARGGLDMEIMPEELYWLRQLDCQRTRNKVVYGTGFLTARNVADKIQAAAAREKIQWELSEREREIVRRLGCGRKDEDG